MTVAIKVRFRGPLSWSCSKNKICQFPGFFKEKYSYFQICKSCSVWCQLRAWWRSDPWLHERVGKIFFILGIVLHLQLVSYLFLNMDYLINWTKSLHWLVSRPSWQFKSSWGILSKIVLQITNICNVDFPPLIHYHVCSVCKLMIWPKLFRTYQKHYIMLLGNSSRYFTMVFHHATLASERERICLTKYEKICLLDK